MNRLLVIGPCCYPSTAPAQLFLNSASKQGLIPFMYGIGQPFTAHGADAQVVKLLVALNDLKDQFQFVLVTDVADVLMLAGEDEIVDKFLRYDTPLVMSAEKEHWPDEGIAGQFPEDPHGYRWINAGQYIGEMQYVILCLEWLLKMYRGKHPGMDNSQPWWSQAYVRKELSFKIDSECRLFQTMSGGAEHDIEVAPPRITNIRTGSTPCSVHFNGPGNEKPHEDMYRRLFE